MFFGQHQWFYVSKKTTYKAPIVGQVGGCNKTVFIACVLQNLKVIGFAHFGQKRTIKIGISAHFEKQQKAKNNTILRGYYLVQVGVIIWSKFGLL